MPHATPELPGIGAVQPNGNAYKPATPVTADQVRALGRDRNTVSMVVTERGGVPMFHAVAVVDGVRITVDGEIEADQ